MYNLLVLFNIKGVFLEEVLALIVISISTADYITTILILSSIKNICNMRELGILFYFVGAYGQYIIRTAIYLLLVLLIYLAKKNKNEQALFLLLLILLLMLFGNTLAVTNNLVVIISCNAVQSQQEFFAIKFALLYITTIAVWGVHKNDS